MDIDSSKGSREFIIIGGPNGAGKTTFSKKILGTLLEDNRFINADFFAEKLSPNDTSKVAIAAGKEFITEVNKLLKLQETFAIESTLSGKSLLKTIKKAKNLGYKVRLFFLWIDSVELCDFRVKARVASGGHNIPIGSIIRRYHRGLSNIKDYMTESHEASIYFANETPCLVVSKLHDGTIEINNSDLYKKFNLSQSS